MIQITTEERFHKAGFTGPYYPELAAFVEDEKRIVREEAVKLLRECEPYLSDHSGVGITTLAYIPPAQAMRNAADRIEYEQALKERVRKFLSQEDTKKQDNNN